MADDTRDRLQQAMLRCAARSGFRFTIEEVAAEAGMSRATVYRYFPDGRDQLINEGVAWEVANFFTGVSVAVRERDDLAGKIEEALIVGRHQLTRHEVLQQVLSVDAEQLVARLEGPIERVEEGIAIYVASLLAGEDLADRVDVVEAADYIARLYLSYLGSPGRWDLEDPEAVHHLVTTQFVPGILQERGKLRR